MGPTSPFVSRTIGSFYELSIGMTRTQVCLAVSSSVTVVECALRGAGKTAGTAAGRRVAVAQAVPKAVLQTLLV